MGAGAIEPWAGALTGSTALGRPYDAAVARCRWKDNRTRCSECTVRSAIANDGGGVAREVVRWRCTGCGTAFPAEPSRRIVAVLNVHRASRVSRNCRWLTCRSICWTCDTTRSSRVPGRIRHRSRVTCVVTWTGRAGAGVGLARSVARTANGRGRRWTRASGHQGKGVGDCPYAARRARHVRRRLRRRDQRGVKAIIPCKSRDEPARRFRRAPGSWRRPDQCPSTSPERRPPRASATPLRRRCRAAGGSATGVSGPAGSR
jgi:hypothetical protein